VQESFSSPGDSAKFKNTLLEYQEGTHDDLSPIVSQVPDKKS
jgi:hypothetical protein